MLSNISKILFPILVPNVHAVHWSVFPLRLPSYHNHFLFCFLLYFPISKHSRTPLTPYTTLIWGFPEICACACIIFLPRFCGWREDRIILYSCKVTHLLRQRAFRGKPNMRGVRIRALCYVGMKWDMLFQQPLMIVTEIILTFLHCSRPPIFSVWIHIGFKHECLIE